MTAQKDSMMLQEDLLIVSESLEVFQRITFDNMSTVSNTNVTPKKPTDSIMLMAKDFGFKVRLCKAFSTD